MHTAKAYKNSAARKKSNLKQIEKFSFLQNIAYVFEEKIPMPPNTKITFDAKLSIGAKVPPQHSKYVHPKVCIN